MSWLIETAVDRVAAAGFYMANVIRGGKPAPTKRMSATYVSNLVCGTALVMILLMNWITSAWSIGLATQLTKCLPGTAYLISRSVPDKIQRGQVVAYASKGLAPLLADGREVVKIAAGVPGDVVKVDATGVSVNGRHWGPLNAAVMKKAGTSVNRVKRTYRLGPNQFLVLGTLSRTYDGRYWGPIERKQLIGTARVLW